MGRTQTVRTAGHFYCSPERLRALLRLTQPQQVLTSGSGSAPSSSPTLSPSPGEPRDSAAPVPIMPRWLHGPSTKSQPTGLFFFHAKINKWLTVKVPKLWHPPPAKVRGDLIPVTKPTQTPGALTGNLRAHCCWRLAPGRAAAAKLGFSWLLE